jgi:hypothetical protein
MMDICNQSELNLIQNPILGAHILWQFGLAYQEGTEIAAPLPLAFLVLPLTLHAQTLEMIRSTRDASGLALFAAKVAEVRERLIAVHERTRSLRALTLQSLAMGTTAQLLTLDFKTAQLRANHMEGPRSALIPERVRPLLAGSEKLGHWFARLPLDQVARSLQVHY